MQTVLDTLRRDGIALTTATALLGPDLAAALAEQAAVARVRHARLLDFARAGALKGFGERRFDKSSYLVKVLGERPFYEADSPWVKVAECPGLVGLAGAYLAAVPHLKAFNLWYTVPAQQAPRDSQLWHRDGDDASMLKLFVYFSDVTVEAGPLVYIPGTHAHRVTLPVQADLDYAGVPRATDPQMRAVVPEAQWMSATGPAGTAVLVDTSGWHKGGHGRVDRYLYTALYTTRPAPFGMYYVRESV